MELGDYLRDIVDDMRQSSDAKRLAMYLLEQHHAGLIVSPRRIKQLRRMLEQPHLCARLRADGTCPWLRTHTRAEGLRAPNPGEKIYCHRRASGSTRESFEGCTGYRRLRELNADLDA